MEIKTDGTGMGNSGLAKFTSADREFEQLTRRLAIQQTDNQRLADFINRRELWLDVYKHVVRNSSDTSATHNAAKLRADLAVKAYDDQFKG